MSTYDGSANSKLRLGAFIVDPIAARSTSTDRTVMSPIGLIAANTCFSDPRTRDVLWFCRCCVSVSAHPSGARS
ncbi:MAG: hypothetical protein ACP5P4_15915 [Steroidobacteraceae bacterium]